LLLQLWIRLTDRLHALGPDDAGQTTTEYAIVLTAVAAMVGLFGLWARDTDRIGKLFDAVLDRVTGTLS
jgi:hypothetical protein